MMDTLGQGQVRIAAIVSEGINLGSRTSSRKPVKGEDQILMPTQCDHTQANNGCNVAAPRSPESR